MESSAQRGYEFTTPRIVFLVIAILFWLLLGVAAMAREDGEADYRVGILLGSLFVSLLVSWIVRSGYRVARGRPAIHPAWTPGLFLGAVIIQFLSAAGNSAPS